GEPVRDEVGVRVRALRRAEPILHEDVHDGGPVLVVVVRVERDAHVLEVRWHGSPLECADGCSSRGQNDHAAAASARQASVYSCAKRPEYEPGRQLESIGKLGEVPPHVLGVGPPTAATASESEAHSTGANRPQEAAAP